MPRNEIHQGSPLSRGRTSPPARESKKPVANQGCIPILLLLKCPAAVYSHGLSTHLADINHMEPAQGKEVALPAQFFSSPVEGIPQVLDVDRPPGQAVEKRIAPRHSQDGMVIDFPIDLIVALIVTDLASSEKAEWSDIGKARDPDATLRINWSSSTSEASYSGLPLP